MCINGVEQRQLTVRFDTSEERLWCPVARGAGGNVVGSTD
jgi:hypothetical protein